MNTANVKTKPVISLPTDPIAIFSKKPPKKDTFENEDIWPQYEHRPEQEEMAQAVLQSIENQEILLVEAGTGIGKTLAYLVPLLFFAQKNKKRVVVSTETKSLQQQILNKDLPLAQKLLGTKVHAELCFGTANFVCKRRLEDNLHTGRLDPYMSRHLESFLEWENNSRSGIRQEYHGPLSESFWQNINRDPLDCLGKRCPYYEISPYFVARRQWQRATLLIVNHSLLAQHFALEAKLLPEFQYLVIDEAHRFTEVLQHAFTLQGSLQEMRSLVHELDPSHRFDEKKFMNYLDELHDVLAKELLKKGTNRSEKISHELPLKSIYSIINDIEKLTKELTHKQELLKSQQSLALQEEVALMELSLEELQLNSQISRLEKFYKLFEKLAATKEKQEVVWLEEKQSRSSKTGTNQKVKDLTIFCASLNSGNFAQESIFSQLSSTILTSATLGTSNKDPFSYFIKELGFASDSELRQLKLNSPFRYDKQALLYLPQNIADPVHATEKFHNDSAKEIHRLLQLSKGGAFVLFTSIRSLTLTQQILESDTDLYRQKNYKIFSQVALGASASLKAFQADKHGALFGLATFWQGIDILGDLLRMVIITRIPFRVPDEPILSARLEMAKENGENGFLQLQVPPAVLSLRQGFGRLIRSFEDRGVVTILDPRLQTRLYGQDILKLMPPAQRYHQFSQLKTVYEKLFS